MSRPPTINDFKSFSDLQEAIDEFKRYSDRSTSLYERTLTCFHEIMESVPSDKAEAVQSAFSKHEDVKRELQKSPSVFFIGERNCGKSSILNELLRQSSLPVHENPCTARIVRIKYSEESYARLVGPDGTEVKRESFTSKHLPENLIVIKDEDRENEETLEATVEVGLNHKLLRSGIELIDSPGKSESEVLDRVLDDFLHKDTVPLFVYVISGDTRLTCSIRKLTIEGMALNFLQIFGPVTLGLPIAKARYGGIYECTSRRWSRASPSNQCVVKVLDRRVVGESVWNQTAVDLVNMMNIIEKVHASHTNLLRLHGWVIPEVDVLHVVMEKADRSLLSALQEGLPLYRRMRIALDVSEGLKAIHDVDYVYEDLKPGNILLMSDGTAKINLAKPESPYDMTPLGAPFHISPEMYQYHGKGHLSYRSYDIFAFGMLLWVLREGTGTARPVVYKDLESIEAMKNVVVEGFLPERLPVVSDACWELMRRCWEERETLQMVHVVTKLQLILEECMS